jgi:hypothetical protein
MEYPNTFIKNPDIEMQCPDTFGNGRRDALTGASVVHVGGRDLLRIEERLMDSRETAIRYIDASFTGEGWWIEDAGMLSGEQPQDENKTIYEEIPTVHREGFKEAELTFVFDSQNPESDKRDPDEPYYYDSEEKYLMPTLRESAQYALQQLFDMTGYQVEECYVLSTGSTLYFSMDDKAFNFGSFYYYAIIPGLNPWNLFISYKNDGANSPIDTTDIVVPKNLSGMSDEQIAQWYYENSTFGDRRKVVSTGLDIIGAVRLYLENGDFYEVTLNKSDRVIQRITGPYEKGFEH